MEAIPITLRANHSSVRNQYQGEFFRPMSVTVDRQQGGNTRVTVALLEGKNCEFRQAMEPSVLFNHLALVGHCPFQLGK